MPLLLKALRSRRDEAELLGRIDRLRRDLAAVDDQLASLQAELEADAVASVGAEVDASWWQARERTVRSVRRRGQRDEAMSLWLSAWSSALSIDAWTLARQIARSDAVDPDDALVRRLVRVVDCLQYGWFVGLAAELSALLDYADLPEEPAMVLGVLQVRTLLRLGEPVEEVCVVAERTLRRSGGRPHGGVLTAANRGYWSALALCCLAEAHLACHHHQDAARYLAEASKAQAAPVDLHIALGLSNEAPDRWPIADVEYEKAVAGGADPTRTALLRPAPPRLRLRAAEALQHTDPGRALELLELALEAGINGEGVSPDAEAYALKGQLLSRLGRSVQAGKAFSEAADRHSAAGQAEAAIELYRLASRAPEASAETWWRLAEELRMHAVDPDECVRVGQLTEARDAVEAGLRLAEPEQQTAWVLITQALVISTLTELGRPDDEAPDPLVLMERNLLLNPGEGLSYGFLTVLLRRAGLVTDALKAAEQGYARTSEEGFVYDQLFSLLLDVDADDRARQLARSRLDTSAEPSARRLNLAEIDRRAGRFEAALEVLSEADSNDLWVRLGLAATHSSLGDHEQAEREFRALADDAEIADRRGLAGWAFFRSGQFEEALAIYAELAEQAPRYMPYVRDLGQMRLARGDSLLDDLIEGERLLTEGIAACVSPAELNELRLREFDMLRALVAGREHAEPVHAVLHRAGERARNRIHELRASRRDPSSLSGRLAAARQAIDDQDDAAAYRLYLLAAEDDRLPRRELAIGLLRPTLALFNRADVHLDEGRYDAAVEDWAMLDAATGLVADGHILAAALAARRATAALTRSPESAPDRLREALEHPYGPQLMGEAMARFVRSPADLWDLHDALVDLGREDRPGWSLDAETLRELLDVLPFTTAYRLDRAQIPGKFVSAPVAKPIEIRLGVGLHDLGDDLESRVRQLRDTLSEEMGVKFPGVRPNRDRSLPGVTVEVAVWEQPALRLTPTSADRVTEIVDALEDVLRSQLYRLIGPDDLRQWLKKWEPTSASHPRLQLPDDPGYRLRLLRVLRMLLREGVSIKDREAILGAFSGPEGRDEFGGPLAALRAVRAALSANALGMSEGRQPRPLPEELEERVRAGLSSTESDRWERSRDVASLLVRDLRSWLADDPAGSGARVVVVADPRVRPFVWRLCAAEQPPVPVLAVEETEHAVVPA